MSIRSIHSFSYPYRKYRKMLESVGQDYANDVPTAKQQRKCTAAPKTNRRPIRRTNFYPFLDILLFLIYLSRSITYKSY
jgi:hypothetical protein